MVNHYRTAILLILFNACVFGLSAQDIVVGNTRNLWSKTYNESREIWVSLPSSYSDRTYAPASYPVLYVLDPGYHFQSMVAVRDVLTSGMYNYMQEMIIVGITNNDRSRELTPTNSSVIHSGKKIHETSGGAKEFLSFIAQELIPFIDSAYRTTSFRLLVGHSFGGLFTLYALTENPQLFHAYIVHDPSIWWDNKALYRSALARWQHLNLRGRTLYLSMAYNEEKETDRFAHSQSISMFKTDIIDAFPQTGLRFHFDYYEKENHGTLFLPATYNAMRFVYDGICLPVKQIPDNPALLDSQYLQVSQKLQFTVTPSEKLVDQLADYCMTREQYKSAQLLLQKNVSKYPSSSHAYTSLGNFYRKMNQEDLAQQAFGKASGLSSQQQSSEPPSK